MTERVPDLSEPTIARIVAAHRPTRVMLPGLRAAAVLIPLFTSPNDSSTRLWLLERTDDGGAHGGQVALPGGKLTADDADLQAAALREAWEELGIAQHSVHVLGQLNDYATITGFKITPFVGWVPSSFVPTPNVLEVARTFDMPLSTFLKPGTRNWVRWARFQRLVRSYPVGDAIVWGATAAILRSFGELLNSMASSSDPP